jgi:hypothetical protein
VFEQCLLGMVPNQVVGMTQVRDLHLDRRTLLVKEAWASLEVHITNLRL